MRTEGAALPRWSLTFLLLSQTFFFNFHLYVIDCSYWFTFANNRDRRVSLGAVLATLDPRKKPKRASKYVKSYIIGPNVGQHDF